MRSWELERWVPGEGGGRGKHSCTLHSSRLLFARPYLLGNLLINAFVAYRWPAWVMMSVVQISPPKSQSHPYIHRKGIYQDKPYSVKPYFAVHESDNPYFSKPGNCCLPFYISDWGCDTWETSESELFSRSSSSTSECTSFCGCHSLTQSSGLPYMTSNLYVVHFLL